MRNPRFFLAFAIIIGAMGVSAFIAPFGIKPAIAQTVYSITYAGSDLRDKWHSFAFSDTYSLGLGNGCGAAAWDVGLNGWANPVGCGDSYTDGTGTNIVRSLELNLSSLPTTVHIKSIEATGYCYNSAFLAFDRQYVIIDSAAYYGFQAGCLSSVINGVNVQSTPSGVNGAITLVWLADSDMAVQSIKIGYTTDAGTSCDNLCIPVGPGPGGSGGSGICVSCTYAPIGDLTQDAPSLIEYLFCLLKQLYFCWLNQTLALIFRYILYIVLLLQSVIIWGIGQADALLIWFVGLLMTSLMWVGGMMQNMTNQIVEAIYFARGGATTIVSGGSSNIWDVLIALVNGLGSVINGLTSGLTSIINGLTSALSVLIVQLGNVIIVALNDTFGVLIALINAILFIIVTIIQIIGVIIVALIQLIAIIVQTIGAIVLSIIQGVMGGFTAPVSNPLEGISGLASSSSGLSIASTGSSVSTVTGVCANNIVIHFCIGAYVLDNTIFSAGSPATGAFWLLIAAIWFDRLMWAAKKSKSAVSYG